MSTAYSIRITYRGTPSRKELDAWEARLRKFDGATAAQPDAKTFTVSVWLESVRASRAGEVAYRKITDVVGPQHTPAGMLIATEDETMHEALSGLPALVTAVEVAERLGVSRQRVGQLTKTDDFPEPAYRLRTGAVWFASEIDAFAAGRTPRGGRPAA